MLILSKNDSSIRKSLYSPIQLDPSKRHELALIRLEAYNSIPNVNDNIFQYAVNGLIKTISIPTGSYELKEPMKTH